MTKSETILAQRRSLFWRIHFWAALIASPFAIVAALTGILYVFSPQIERVLYGGLDRVTPAGQRRPLDEVVQAAKAAGRAGLTLKSVVVPAQADESVKVLFGQPRKESASAAPGAAGAHAAHSHGAAKEAAPAGAAPAPLPLPLPLPSSAGERVSQTEILYLNPYTAEVLGRQGEMDRFNMWARRLHSSLVQGNGWRWLIELSASWLMVMLLTGVYLWWPRGAAQALPGRAARGRIAWKQWHAFAGVVLSVMSLAILTTGLTWSRYAGGQIRSFRDAIGQAPPSPQRGLKSMAMPGEAALSWEAILRTARRQAPEVALQITPPNGPQGVWRLSDVDRGQPEKRVNLVLDAYTGKALFYAGWDEQTVFAKATAIGIPFHRGEFGWWNQALLFVFGAGVLFSLVSGWVMYFKRPRQGLLGLPRLLPGAWKSLPIGAWVAAGVLLMTLPLLAASAALVALVESTLGWRQRAPGMSRAIYGAERNH